MSAIYEEFERDLARLRESCAGSPKEELTSLCLLALEREEIVTVAYRDETIGARLARMPIGDEVRELMAHALRWAWKDEEMHAIYIRGALLRAGGPLMRATAYARQYVGAVGGWASSVRQHARWRDAPFSRLAATIVTKLGTLAGKVPRGVRDTLEYGPFRRFCATNVHAEQTAWLCWSRIAELAAGDVGIPPALLRDFERIAADEARHKRIFEILAESLTDDDTLAPGVTAATLEAKIAEVGEAFLPRAWRREGSALGKGGVVHIATGNEKRRAFRELLEAAGLAPPPGARVAIKPTFMLGYHRHDTSIITDPELLDELALFLRERGCADVAVIESPNIYDHFYANRSVAAVAGYLGYHSPHYRLVDASAEQVPHSYRRGIAQYTIARTWREADFRISFAKMRSHPIELAYLTVANVEWIGARCDEFLFCERQAQRETAIMMLLDEFPPHFALLDAFDSAADGLIGVMGCREPRAPRRIYASSDALALDIVAARHMGVLRPRESSILRAASHWFGEPSENIRVEGPDEPVPGWRGPYHNELWSLLAFMAYPVYVLGSGRGSLFVPLMDETVFPPLRRENFLLRATRTATRRLLGLPHAR